MSFNLKQGNIQRFNTYTHSSTTSLKLTTENSGSFIFLDCSANNLTIELPPNENSIGIHFDFLVTNVSNGNTIDIKAVDKAGDPESEKIQITGNFTPGHTATLEIGIDEFNGDRLQIISNGSKWYLNNFVSNNTLSRSN